MTQSVNTDHVSSAIVESLEIVAETAGDIAPQVFERYFKACPDSAKLMDHMDNYMLGRMMDQVLLLLMEDDDTELENYLTFETSSHKSYGVEDHMYQKLFSAVRDTVSEAVGTKWTGSYQDAWRSRIDTLLGKISEAEAALLEA
jgi:hemoglobin-like flavoprotein